MQSSSIKTNKKQSTKPRKSRGSSKTMETISMSCSPPQKPDPVPPPLKAWSRLWLKTKLQSSSSPKHARNPNPKSHQHNKTLVDISPMTLLLVSDRTSLLSDQILLQILSKLPKSQSNSNSLVSKRWLYLQGRLTRSIKLLHWDFLLSGRLFARFPNLIHVDLVHSCVISPKTSTSSSGSILFTQKMVSFYVDHNVFPSGFAPENYLLSVDEVDFGLRSLASGYPNLRKLMVINATELGLLSVAEECPTLQELELHKCNDQVLRGIAACQNLQILKLVGCVDGFYGSLVSDIGLTIMAQGCRRLVKLELSGCEGSYDGIKAIGQCCQMLEELTFTCHRMEGGWLSALSYCENLKTLKIQSCKRIDCSPRHEEHLGCCSTLERLHLERCQLRDKHSVRALFLVCETVREIVIQNCWGLDNDVFSIAGICRRVKFLSLEGCALLTTQGLEYVIVSWKDLERLQVLSCNNVKDSEVTPAFSVLLSDLKEFTWRPETKSILLSNLVGTGMGKKGGRFFEKESRLGILFKKI